MVNRVSNPSVCGREELSMSHTWVRNYWLLTADAGGRIGTWPLVGPLNLVNDPQLRCIWAVIINSVY